MKISGNIVDVLNKEIFPGTIELKSGRIASISRTDYMYYRYIIPGLVDSHIHIESSMVTPGAFAVEAVRHGTVCVVSDPHEIANVLGSCGVDFMIDDAGKVPLMFSFGAPSCVPATSFESSGAVIDHNDIKRLMARKDIGYLSEVMNFPGVIMRDPQLMMKIRAALENGKPVDGHAPGLAGDGLKRYADAGISTDHECSSIEEAREKIALGMKILIREGSAARNLDALKDLFLSNPENIMLCSDDLHPETLVERHINKLVARLVKDGYDIFDVLRSATLNPRIHYNLENGLLRVGDNADFAIVDSPEEMNVLETWIKGTRVFDGKTQFSYVPGRAVNNFNASPVDESQIAILRKGDFLRVIKAEDGSLLTGQEIIPAGSGENIRADSFRGINKIVVKDRYRDALPATGLIRGFSLEKGAFASSVAHDSHNIVAVGYADSDICAAINAVISCRGGLAVADGEDVTVLPLDIAGIMTTRSCREVALAYLALSSKVKEFGCLLSAPFMTLSFMALLVIPELKIGDRGLFDVTSFSPVTLFTGSRS